MGAQQKIAEFDHLLSVDPVRVYKPDDRAYALAEQAFELTRSSILFVSSNAWDATGARYFGFPTCWINRGGSIFEEMGQAPDWRSGAARLMLRDYIGPPVPLQIVYAASRLLPRCTAKTACPTFRHN